MARRDQVQKRCDELGVELTADPSRGFFDVWTPKGLVFSANFCHVLAFHWSGIGPWTAETYDDILESLSYGVEECTNVPCDTCERYDDE